MNCNLVRQRLWQTIGRYKKVIDKKLIVIRTRSSISIRFVFSRMSIIFSRYEKNPDKLNLLAYQENVDLFSWKYTFYDITDNQIKDCKIFSPLCNLKIKALSLKILKKPKKIWCCHRRPKEKYCF